MAAVLPGTVASLSAAIAGLPTAVAGLAGDVAALPGTVAALPGKVVRLAATVAREAGMIARDPAVLADNGTMAARVPGIGAAEVALDLQISANPAAETANGVEEFSTRQKKWTAHNRRPQFPFLTIRSLSKPPIQKSEIRKSAFRNLNNP